MVVGVNNDDANELNVAQPNPEEQGQEQDVQGQEKEESVPKSLLDEAHQEIASLEKQLETLTNTLMNPEYLNVLRGGAQPQVPQPQPEPEVEEEEPNFEEMKPKQVVDYIVKKVTQSIAPRVEEAASTADTVKAKQEIAECMAKYPDFLLYRDAMIQIGREKQAQGIEISAEDAYFIAKGRAQMALAARSTPKPVTAQPPKPKPKPTEKPGLPPDTTGNASLSAREAAERAFAQIFGS